MNRLLILVFIAVWMLSACNLDSNDEEPLPTAIATLAPEGKPTVTIASPKTGDEFVVDEPVILSVNVTDTVGVTRIQLFADEQIVRTISSESPSGDTNKNVLLNHTPSEEGNVTYRVIAYRGTTASDPAEVAVTVRESQSQVTATPQRDNDVPVIDPNDPTCRALINTGLNFRSGPSVNFNVITVLGAGEVIPIIGRLGDNSWWQLLRSGTTVGWVSAGFTTPYGNCLNVPVKPSPATPTSNAPTATPQPTLTPTLAPQPTATPQPEPNLTVTNIDGPDTVVIPTGETEVTETYSMNITNKGGALNAQFSSRVRIIPLGTSFDAGVAGNLGAGQTINLAVEVTFTQAGAFALQFEADDDNQIEESEEGDNSFIFNVTVENE